MDATLRATVRGYYTSLMPDTGSIYRPTTTSGALGTQQTFDLISVEACRYAPPKRNIQANAERTVEGAIIVEADQVVSFPANTDITEKDRIVIEVAETSEMLDMEAVNVQRRTGEFQRRVLCRFLD